MVRFGGIVVVLSLAAGTFAGPAVATGAPETAQALPLVVSAAKTEREKCKALNRCRYHYTVCYNKLEAQHRIAEKDEVCVPPYQKCINATFSGTDWFFTRWFNPSHLDCSKYPG